MQNRQRAELIELEQEWNEAIITNNAEAIAAFMAHDWVLIAPSGVVLDKDRFLETITSGELTHEVMASEDWRVRIYGDAAVVTTRTSSKSTYKGNALSALERVTSVFVRRDGRWQCIITHLTPITDN